MRELKRKGRSSNTIRNYQKAYRVSIQPSLGSLQRKKLTTKILTDIVPTVTPHLPDASWHLGWNLG
ncbi:MAG: hypothetical protein GY926_05040 [bacterium]|nr:hypothetical protein [bacterium]